MPAMRFQACHIRTPQPGEAQVLTQIAHAAKGSWGYPDAWMASWSDALAIGDSALATWSVFFAEQDGKAMAFAERGVRSFAP
jgi:hypothetical protein